MLTQPALRATLNQRTEPNLTLSNYFSPPLLNAVVTSSWKSEITWNLLAVLSIFLGMHMQQVFLFGQDHHVKDRPKKNHPAEGIPGRPHNCKTNHGKEEADDLRIAAHPVNARLPQPPRPQAKKSLQSETGNTDKHYGQSNRDRDQAQDSPGDTIRQGWQFWPIKGKIQIRRHDDCAGSPVVG
jgi:hypothetical protein